MSCLFSFSVKLHSSKKTEWYDEEPAPATFHLLPPVSIDEVSTTVAQPSTSAPDFTAWQEGESDYYSKLRNSQQRGSREVVDNSRCVPNSFL
jgi:hypothetical protein